MDKRDLSKLTLAVAGLLTATACTTATTPGDDGGVGSSADPVKCLGLNDCKGLSECETPDGKSSCQGLNDCKGQGWVTVDTEADCTSGGGTVWDGQLNTGAGGAGAGAAFGGGNPSAGGAAAGGNESQGGATAAQLKCQGINDCKGHGDCAQEGKNECKGLAECAGQGWNYVDSEEECNDKGGTLIS